jgi:hypothetical protein
MNQQQRAVVQEPVWIQPDHLQKAKTAPFLCRVEPHKRDDFVPLYTTQPAQPAAWVGLTDEQIYAIGKELGMKCRLGGNPNIDIDYARAIEAKLKENNT